jgi:hypothetical protein
MKKLILKNASGSVKYSKKQIEQTSKVLYLQIAALINSSKEKVLRNVN